MATAIILQDGSSSLMSKTVILMKVFNRETLVCDEWRVTALFLITWQPWL